MNTARCSTTPVNPIGWIRMNTLGQVPARRWARTVAGVWVLLLMGALSARADPGHTADLDAVRLQLKWHHQFQFAGYYAAVEKGFYHNAGLDVTLVEGGPNVDFVDEVVFNRAEFGVEVPSLVVRRSEGKPVVVLACIFQHSPIALFSLAESQIRSPQDLEGRRVMLRAESDANTMGMILDAGLDPTTVDILPHSFDWQDLEDEKVDAISGYITAFGAVAQAQGLDVRTLRPRDYGYDFYGDCLFTSDRQVEHHATRVEAFRSASLMGWRYAIDNPTEIAELIHREYAPDRSVKDLLREAELMQPMLQHDLVELGHSHAGRWARIASTYARLGLLGEAPPLEGLLYEGPPRSQRWLYLLGVLLALVVIGIGIVWIWNRQLKRAVRTSTTSLRGQQEEHERLVDNLNGAFIYRHDLNGVFQYVSRSVTDVLGYEVAEFQAHFGKYLTDHPDNEAVYQSTALSAAGVRQSPYDVHIRHKNGGTRWLEVSEVPVWDGGEVIAVEGVAFDATARKEAETHREALEVQLFQSQKLEAVGTLAGGVAHDMNNVLAVVLGLGSLLESTRQPGDPELPDIQAIVAAARRGKAMVENLLGFARKGKYRKERVSPNAIVHDVVEMLAYSLPKKVSLTTALADQLLAVECDSAQIGQSLMNLCLNANDALNGKGTITISTSNVVLAANDIVGLEPGHYAKLRVSDDGPGMTRETLRKAFEPFFTTKDLGKGTGLGLSMAYGVVQNHGGSIDIESSPGEGTAVSIWLPAVESDETTADGGDRETHEAADAAESPTPQRLATLLLVDDEEMFRATGKRILEAAGYEVLLADGGASAIETYRDRGPEIDLVVLDLTMPTMDGAECFSSLKEIDPTVRVLICTGHGKSDDTAAMIANGALGLLPKPFEVNEITVAIDAALRTKTPVP